MVEPNLDFSLSRVLMMPVRVSRSSPRQAMDEPIQLRPESLNGKLLTSYDPFAARFIWVFPPAC
jgi:hypothetical protein